VFWGGGGAGPDFTAVGANYYYDGSGYKYDTSSNHATDYYQANGTHNFLVAPSGTADTAITWTTAMTIDNSGRVTTPNQPYFVGTLSGGYHAANSIVPISTTNYTGIVNNGTRLTVPTSGVYFIHAAQLVDPNTSGYAYFTIAINGVNKYHSHSNFTTENNKDYYATLVYPMSVNDYVEIKYMGTDINTSWGNNHSTISMHKLS